MKKTFEIEVFGIEITDEDVAYSMVDSYGYEYGGVEVKEITGRDKVLEEALNHLRNLVDHFQPTANPYFIDAENFLVAIERKE